MKRSPLDDATLVEGGGARRRARRSARARLSGVLPGAWSALLALAALFLLVLLAPENSDAARASLMGVPINPLVLLAASAVLGGLACLSGIRHLRSGDAPVRGTLGVALGACPSWIAASLLLLRALGSGS